MLSLTFRRGQISQVNRPSFVADSAFRVLETRCDQLLSLDVIGIWNFVQRFFPLFVTWSSLTTTGTISQPVKHWRRFWPILDKWSMTMLERNRSVLISANNHGQSMNFIVLILVKSFISRRDKCQSCHHVLHEIRGYIEDQLKTSVDGSLKQALDDNLRLLNAYERGWERTDCVRCSFFLDIYPSVLLCCSFHADTKQCLLSLYAVILHLYCSSFHDLSRCSSPVSSCIYVTPLYIYINIYTHTHMNPRSSPVMSNDWTIRSDRHREEFPTAITVAWNHLV